MRDFCLKDIVLILKWFVFDKRIIIKVNNASAILDSQQDNKNIKPILSGKLISMNANITLIHSIIPFEHCNLSKPSTKITILKTFLCYFYI